MQMQCHFFYAKRSMAATAIAELDTKTGMIRSKITPPFRLLSELDLMACASCFLGQSTSDYCIIAEGSQLIVLSKKHLNLFLMLPSH